MPLAESKIKNLRETNAKLPTTEKRLEQISTYEAKISLPIVLYLLEEIKKILGKIKQNQPGMTETNEFVAYAINILKETDVKQNASIFALPSILKELTKEKIEGELRKFVTDAHQLTVIPQTKLLWEEVALWLEGLYRRTEKKVAKDKDGKILRNKKGEVGTVDAEDAIFNKIVHLTKFDIVSYYHEVAEAISEKCALCLDAEEIPQQEPGTTPTVSAESSAPNQLIKPELPREFLEKYLYDDPDIKFPVLICALNYYKLNDDQQFFFKSV